MGGMIHALRRAYLSGNGPRLRSPAIAILIFGLSHRDAAAQEGLDVGRLLTSLGGLDRQEFAAVALALAILGFSVVAAILLMRTRARAA